MNKLISLISFALLLNACAFHNGVMISNPNFTSPDYVLSSLAIGTASTEKFLGIGGLKTDALVLEAKKNLYSNFPLKKGQSYSNLTVDFKKSFFIIYNKTIVTVSADIVQIDTAQNQIDQFQPIFNQVRKNQIFSFGDINLGDTIKTYSLNRVHDNIVIKILPNNRYAVSTIKNTKTKIKNVDRASIYITKDLKDDSFPFKINQEVSIEGIGLARKGKIIGIGINSAIIEERQGDSTIYVKRIYENLK